MNYKDYVFNKLKQFNESDIIISEHALIRMYQRQINKNEVIKNLLNPKRLKYVIREEDCLSDGEKFDCYFEYSASLCHRYVIIIKENLIVITVVKINRRWQKLAEKKLKNK